MNQERSEEYNAYIVSAEWRARADAAKQRAGWRCQLCNAGDEKYWPTPVYAHHRTYQRLGKEDDMDITVLWGPCHEKHHGILPEGIA